MPRLECEARLAACLELGFDVLLLTGFSSREGLRVCLNEKGQI